MPESQIIIERVVPGAFYQSVEPGGFTDGLTGIHIPGPIVNIHPVTRGVGSVHKMPDPVQIPQFKRTFDIKDNTLEVDANFDRRDAEATAEGLNMALSTGIIRRVPDEQVRDLYPNAWANRSDKITFNPKSAKVIPMAQMVDEFQTAVRKAQAGVASRRDDADKLIPEEVSEKRKPGRPAKKKTVPVAAVTESPAQ